jgi:hypothetical protein
MGCERRKTLDDKETQLSLSVKIESRAFISAPLLLHHKEEYEKQQDPAKNSINRGGCQQQRQQQNIDDDDEPLSAAAAEVSCTVQVCKRQGWSSSFFFGASDCLRDSWCSCISCY